MNQASLSPSLFAVLIEQAAQGKLRSANLVSNVQNLLPVRYNEHGAWFEKLSPGSFMVHFQLNGENIGETPASSPVEAKMLVLDYVIQKAREHLTNVKPQ